jgi:hypothetical protein
MSAETIFFSYSRDDSEFVLNLAKKLRSAGANIWLDQLDIKPGTRWDKSIEKALDSSSTLLVILSKSSMASDNVMDEVSFALEENKVVVPVLLEECDIPFRLRRLQFADFSQDQEKGIKTLTEALHLDSSIASKLTDVAIDHPTEIDKKVEPKPVAVEPPKKEEPVKKEVPKVKPVASKKKSKSKIPIIIGILVVVALAVAGYMFKDDIFQNKDQIAWDMAIEDDNMGEYEKYLALFPKGKFAAIAQDSINTKKQRIDNKFDEDSWQVALKANTATAFQNYIDLEIPIHKYVDEAKQKMADATQQADANAAATTADETAWTTATTEDSVSSYIAYYMATSLLQNHKQEAIDKITEKGTTGWLYAGRTDKIVLTGDILAEVSFRPGVSNANIPEKTFPKTGDIVTTKFSEGSRRTYTTASPRNSINGSWKKGTLAYVLDTHIEGTNALILQVIYQ